jgi:hypothetical protein
MMQNDGKIQTRLIFLFISNIMLLLLVTTSSNYVFAQKTKESHQETLYEIANPTISN